MRPPGATFSLFDVTSHTCACWKSSSPVATAFRCCCPLLWEKRGQCDEPETRLSHFPSLESVWLGTALHPGDSYEILNRRSAQLDTPDANIWTPTHVPVWQLLKTLHPLGANAASSCCLLCLRFDLHLLCEGMGIVGGLDTTQAGSAPWRGGVGPCPVQGQILTYTCFTFY